MRRLDLIADRARSSLDMAGYCVDDSALMQWCMVRRLDHGGGNVTSSCCGDKVEGYRGGSKLVS